MATRRDNTTKPAGPVNARMAREGGPKDESGTPFRVRGEQQSPGKRPDPEAPGGSEEPARDSYRARDDDVK